MLAWCGGGGGIGGVVGWGEFCDGLFGGLAEEEADDGVLLVGWGLGGEWADPASMTYFLGS